MDQDRARKSRPSISRKFIASAVMLCIAAVSANAAQAAGVAWHGNLQEAAKLAATQHKPLLVMVKARWCGPCHKMLAQTFPNPAVAARINSSFIPVLIDADEQAAVVQSLGIEAMPTVLVISPEHKVTGRLTGFQSAAQLDAQLAALAPAPIRQFPPQQFRHWGVPAATPSLAMRPAATPSAGSSFLRRHAIANLPVRNSLPVRPSLPPRLGFAESHRSILLESPRPGLLADATPFGGMDTLSAARAFSAGGSPREAAIAAGPTPIPPD